MPNLCVTEEDYLIELSLSNNSWWDKENKCHWIFRGQNSSDQLMPSLYRKVGSDAIDPIYQHLFDKMHESLIYGVSDLATAIRDIIIATLPQSDEKKIKNLSTVIKAAFIELSGTEKFLERCNRVLLPTPTLQLFKEQLYGETAVEYLYNHLKEFITEFDSSHGYRSLFLRENHEALALARHHAISSRLLDWSEDPLIAAFFSAVKAKNDDSICVWALNKRYLRANPHYGQIEFYNKLSRIGLEFLIRRKLKAISFATYPIVKAMM